MQYAGRIKGHSNRQASETIQVKITLHAVEIVNDWLDKIQLNTNTNTPR
jgi:hypothetical protein